MKKCGKTWHDFCWWCCIDNNIYIYSYEHSHRLAPVLISWLVLIIRKAYRKKLSYMIFSLFSNIGGVQIKRGQPAGERGSWNFGISSKFCCFFTLQIFLRLKTCITSLACKYSSKIFLKYLNIPQSVTSLACKYSSACCLETKPSRALCNSSSLWRMPLSGRLIYICLENTFVWWINIHLSRECLCL